MQFGSAETRMKQLQMKLRETESAKTLLGQEASKLRREMKGQEHNISKAVQSKLETHLIEIINDMSKSFREYEASCQKHGHSQITLLEKKELVNSQMQAIFKVIGKEHAYNAVQEDLRKGRTV